MSWPEAATTIAALILLGFVVWVFFRNDREP